ncbi:MAG: glycosyltransferase family 4 protein [Candidatus Peregrinibacteria bacterium]|nr:glycosyltransferase family 4 protein [Candidatus Peregrinibacteria bacterium]
MERPESGHRFMHEGEGGEVYFHPCPRSLLFQVPWILNKGTLLIEQHGHDVMTVHDYPPFYNSTGARLLKKKTGVPYALELHHIVGCPKAADLSEWIGCLMTRIHVRFGIGSASGIRVVNETTRNTLVSWGVHPQMIHVVPSFYLDSEVLGADLRPPIAYDISFCGRLVPNKGLREVIMAVSLLPDARLLVIGDGPERQSMETLTKKLGIENRVTFLGWLPTQEAVIGAIQTARMFIMNSTSEGGPRVALEAMGCGMPVLSTRVGVMPEVIHDGVNGMFTSGTCDDVAQKISILLRDDSLRERIADEAKKVLKTYERSTLVCDYADFLKKLP